MDKLEDVWTTRDFPVLREVARQLDSQPFTEVRPSVVMEATGIDEDDLLRSAIALESAGLVELSKALGAPLRSFRKISPEARRIVGLWPDAGDATDRLLWALEQRIERTTDPDERSRLAKLRDAVAGVGRDLMVEVTAAMLTRGM